MKIVKGNFKEKKKRPLNEKITEALSKIQELHGAEAEGNYVLLTQVDQEIYISSDLTVEDFNFLLDMVKLNVLQSVNILGD
jgi:hypothetical protein